LVIGGELIDTSSLGGLEIHTEYGGETFGLVQDSEGLEAKQTLLETVLWALAYQSPEFVDSDGTVRIAEFVRFLISNNGIDPEVFFPKDQTDAATHGEPGVERSEPLPVNLNLPVIITNARISGVEGINPQNFFFINPFQGGGVQSLVGTTEEGQLFISDNLLDVESKASPTPLIPHDEVGSLLTEHFVFMMAVLGNITHKADSPQEQLTGPAHQSMNPIFTVKVPERFAVPDLSRFLFLDLGGKAGERIFEVLSAAEEPHFQQFGPPLPPAGDQPDDAALAEAEIRANFELLFNLDVPLEQKAEQLLDDTEGVQQARDHLSPAIVEATKSATRTVTEFVFVSPTEAWFKYDLKTIFGDQRGRFGIAYLIGGEWKIARAVICQDLSLGGSPCNPPVSDIAPVG